MFPRRGKSDHYHGMWSSRLRICLGTMIFVVSMCTYIIIVAVLVNMEYLSNRKAELIAYFNESNATTTWNLEFKRYIINASADVISLKGFCLRYMEMYGLLESSCTENLNSCDTQRENMMKDAKLNGHFDLISTYQISSSNSISSIMLAPNGVVSNQVPLWPNFISQNMFNRTETLQQVESAAKQARDTAKPVTAGPFRFAFTHSKTFYGEGGADSGCVNPWHDDTFYHNSSWYALIISPIFAAVNTSLKSQANFWGFINVLMNISDMIEESEMKTLMQENMVDYVLYDIDKDNTINVISSSKFEKCRNPTQEEIREFLETCSDASLVYPNVNLYLAVHANNTHLESNPDRLCAIIFMSTSILFLVLTVSCVTMLRCTRTYDGNLYAPKSAPFAILSIGPVHADDLWSLVPVPMAAVMDKFNKLFDRQLRRHHGCRIVQMHPYTNSCITRTVEAAIEMAMDLLTEMQRRPIDASLRELLSEDEGMLMMCCGIHWCTRASVSAALNHGDGPRYDGEDVIFASRMWVHTLPNHVTISAAAEPYARAMPRVRVTRSHDVFVRGQPVRQSLYTVTDEHNKHLQKAAHRARLSLQREYAAYLHEAHEQGKMQTKQQQQQQQQQTVVKPELSITRNERSLSSMNVYARMAVQEPADPFGSRPGKKNTKQSPTGVRRRRSSSARSESEDCAMESCTMSDSITWQQVIEFYMHEHKRRLHLVNLPISLVHDKPNQLSPTGTERVDEKESEYEHGADYCCRNGEYLTKECSTVPERKGNTEAQKSELNENNTTQRTGQEDTIHRCSGGAQQTSENNSTKVVAAPAALSSSAALQCSCSFALMPETDKIIRRLMCPSIPAWLNRNLQRAYEHQAIVLDVEFSSVHVMTYYFYTCFRLLLSPLATPERNNLYRRLRMAFGVPQQHILEHLAARCTIVYIQQQEHAQECGDKLFIRGTDSMSRTQA